MPLAHPCRRQQTAVYTRLGHPPSLDRRRGDGSRPCRRGVRGMHHRHLRRDGRQRGVGGVLPFCG